MGQDRATPPIDREKEKKGKKPKQNKKKRGEKKKKPQKDRKKVIYNDKTIAARHGRYCMYQAGVCAQSYTQKPTHSHAHTGM